jgi:glutaredoxin
MINIYGKQNCNWCDRAKATLTERSIPFSYYSVGEDVGIDFILEKFPGVKTVPIVEINGKHIGGYEDLKQYLEETSGGHADHI